MNHLKEIARRKAAAQSQDLAFLVRSIGAIVVIALASWAFSGLGKAAEASTQSAQAQEAQWEEILPGSTLR